MERRPNILGAPDVPGLSILPPLILCRWFRANLIGKAPWIGTRRKAGTILG
jgi:hypothetical protein